MLSRERLHCCAHNLVLVRTKWLLVHLFNIREQGGETERSGFAVARGGRGRFSGLDSLLTVFELRFLLLARTDSGGSMSADRRASAGPGSAGASTSLGSSSAATSVLPKPRGFVFSPNLEHIRTVGAMYMMATGSVPSQKGKELSVTEREARGLTAATLVYGEIRFEPFAIIFQKIRELYGGLSRPGGKFVDLGSGTGKPVLAAALLHEWDSCTGIELLHGLHEAALELHSAWTSPRVREMLPASAQRVEIQFLEADFTKVEWADADVVYAASTCFDEVLMRACAAAADRCHIGTFFVSLSKRLPSAKWLVRTASREIASVVVLANGICHNLCRPSARCSCSSLRYRTCHGGQ